MALLSSPLACARDATGPARLRGRRASGADEALARQVLRAPAAEPLQHARADVGERPVVAPAAGPGADGEQRRVLARVVAVRRGRVDAVVGGEHEQVTGAEALVDPFAHRAVDQLERLREAGDVVAAALDMGGL